MKECITSASPFPTSVRRVAAVAERNRELVLGGEYNGVTFAYLPTGADLGVITEIFDAPPGDDQEPDSVYP